MQQLKTIIDLLLIYTLDIFKFRCEATVVYKAFLEPHTCRMPSANSNNFDLEKFHRWKPTDCTAVLRSRAFREDCTALFKSVVQENTSEVQAHWSHWFDLTLDELEERTWHANTLERDSVWKNGSRPSLSEPSAVSKHLSVRAGTRIKEKISLNHFANSKSRRATYSTAVQRFAVGIRKGWWNILLSKTFENPIWIGSIKSAHGWVKTESPV